MSQLLLNGFVTGIGFGIGLSVLPYAKRLGQYGMDRYLFWRDTGRWNNRVGSKRKS